MLDSFLHMISHNVAVIGSAFGHSPQAAFATVLCAIMVNLFN
ncbi:MULTISPECIES: YshB family small membrane protein [Pantoea]|nr:MULTISPECIES: YshB family small membrane protein [Pantoea]MBS6437163.1 YshB family small membrane protein [Pantoea sp.]MDU1574881.1 YshB family small membrane protein [Pantoea sp.]MDU2731190.1 YshB family small membrane protein [Pantoea sp.]MDU5474992.1 YshB family small membrane protein [Pantoea sp.]MDU6080128.1 YshB family small membrane protein [Pantoea sp.]